MSKSKRSAEETKKRILHTAESHFASKGFHGARVDEIAKDAGVNKAMIYYYFESKQQLLDHLLQHFIQESMELLMRSLREGADQDAEKMVLLEQFDLIFDEYLVYLENKKPILRILLTQAIRGEKEGALLFQLIGEAISRETDYLLQEFSSYGMIIDMERNQMLVTEFFTSIFPIITYVVFKESLAEYLQISDAKLKGYFKRALELTHVAYHKNLYYEKISQKNED